MFPTAHDCTMTGQRFALGKGAGILRTSVPFRHSRSPSFLTAPTLAKFACRVKVCVCQHKTALKCVLSAEGRPHFLRHAAAIACIGLLQLAHPVLAAEQSGPLTTPSTESATTPLSAPAADDKTRLVRSQLLQDGASDVQPPSTSAQSAAVPSSFVQGQGAPEPKAASPATFEASEPAPAQGTESQSVQPRSTPPSTSPPAPAPPKESGSPVNGSKSFRQEETEKEAKKLLDEEEERRKTRRRKKGRIRELEEIRAELAEKELVLLGKEQELLERDQTVQVLREELDLERKLRTLLTKEKEKAEEEAALAMGLCTGGSIF